MAIPVDGVTQHPQVQALHESIGRFVVEFEQMCHAMQSCITFILYKAGLHDQSLSQIILAGHTAEPLRSLFESLVGQTVPLNDTERRMVKNVTSRIQKLTNERNDVIHSAWFIGWGDSPTDDFSTASGHKFHKNKDGVSHKNFSVKVEDFSTLTYEASSLKEILHRLNGCFSFNMSVEKNFVFLENGALSVPPAVGNILN